MSILQNINLPQSMLHRNIPSCHALVTLYRDAIASVTIFVALHDKVLRHRTCPIKQKLVYTDGVVLSVGQFWHNTVFQMLYRLQKHGRWAYIAQHTKICVC
jgi:hypothetical protein